MRFEIKKTNRSNRKLTAIHLWIASAIRCDKYEPALSFSEVTTNRDDKVFVEDFTSANQVLVVSKPSAAHT